MNSDNLKKYAEKVNLLAAQSRNFALRKVDESHNEMADKMAKIVSGETPNDMGVTIELLSTLEHIYPLQQSILDSPTWIDELVNYICSDILPEDKNKAR